VLKHLSRFVAAHSRFLMWNRISVLDLAVFLAKKIQRYLLDRNLSIFFSQVKPIIWTHGRYRL